MKRQGQSGAALVPAYLKIVDGPVRPWKQIELSNLGAARRAPEPATARGAQAPCEVPDGNHGDNNR